MRKLLSKRNYSLNILIVSIPFILGFVLLYFFINRQRSQATAYVSGFLLRPQNITFNAPIDWVPYWLGNSVNVGDREISPWGQVTASVVEKLSMDSSTNGQTVTLILKINAVKDRSGVNLYKNKPLAVGTVLNLNLGKTQLAMYVTSVDDKPPERKFTDVRVKLKGINLEPEIISAFNLDDTIKTDNNLTIAKIIQKQVNPSEILTNIQGTNSILNLDSDKMDMILTIDLLAEKLGTSFYTLDYQRLIPGNTLFLSFPTGNINNYQIISMEDLKADGIK